MIFMQGSNKVLSTTIIILLCIIVITVTRQNFSLQEENSNTRALEREKLMSSQQRLELSQPRQSNMVGGYSNLGGGDKSLLKSEQMAIVANFALNEHAAKTSSAEGDSTNESLLSVSPDDVESGKVVAVVLEAQRQVVAGLNYKLTIALMKDSICIGALKVIVYDHFGELSVTKWGDQLTCLDVQELLDEVQVEEEEETAIEVEERIEEEVEAAKPNERRG